MLKLCPLPDDREKFLVCCRSPILQYMSVDGIFSSKIDAKTDVADACLSAKGRFIYALGDDGSLRIFKTEDTSELLTEVGVSSIAEGDSYLHFRISAYFTLNNFLGQSSLQSSDWYLPSPAEERSRGVWYR